MSILPLVSQQDSATIVRAAERRLRHSPYFFLRCVTCQVENGALTLRGRVPFGQLKQFAEAIVLRVDGVRVVVNEIEVYDPEVVALQPARGA